MKSNLLAVLAFLTANLARADTYYPMQNCSDATSKRLADEVSSQVKFALNEIKGALSIETAHCPRRWVPKTLGYPTPMDAEPPSCGALIRFESKTAMVEFARYALTFGGATFTSVQDGETTLFSNVAICGEESR